MTDINQLSAQDTLGGADQLVIWSSVNGDTRRISLSALIAYITQQITSSSFTTQYAAPNATGFSVSVSPLLPGASTFLLLTPLAGYAAGTIVLPAQAQCVDGQELLLATTQAVTALTVSGNGSNVNGAPTALTANGFFRMRYDGVNKSWYRV